ncbi:MAG: histidine phosphatase family protein [Acidocella sp. 20-63-7]|nr:MAG: histidine phosphatase family protein [Acidocella sp. 20-63-7]HQT46627.1 histidine phosphatase family protein [Acidocella sp.]
MYLLRHGQSYFNLYFTETRVDPGIEDPELTPLGLQQAKQAVVRLEGVALTRIVVSPYIRALQTVEPIRAAFGMPVEVMHEVRERTTFVCDVGSSPDALGGRFPQHDFAHLPQRWWHESHEPPEETVGRAAAFRKLMAGREDSDTTLVVSHWGFILALTGISVTNGEILEYDPKSAAPEQIVWRP